MMFSLSPHTVSLCAEWLSGAVDIPTSNTPDAAPLHTRHAPATFLIPAPCVPAFARMPVHSSGLVSEGQPTFRLYAARIASRLQGAQPHWTPNSPKAGKAVKRVKPVRSAAVVVRVFLEKRDILRLNAGLHGMSMSDYIRQTCLGIRLRRTAEDKRRLR